MRDEEIRRRIAGFPEWHYRFDLEVNPTPIPNEDWAINLHKSAFLYHRKYGPRPSGLLQHPDPRRSRGGRAAVKLATSAVKSGK